MAEPILEGLAIAADAVTAGLETGAVAGEATVGIVEASAALPSMIEMTATGGETALEAGSGLSAVTGSDIAAAVEGLEFEELADIDLERSLEDTFSPFRKIREEQFAEFPDLEEEVVVLEDIEQDAEEKVIPINRKVARKLGDAESTNNDTAEVEDGKPEARKTQEPLHGDMVEGEEVSLKKEGIEDALKKADLPEHMRAKLSDVINLLKEHPDLMSELADIESLDKDKKRKL